MHIWSGKETHKHPNVYITHNDVYLDIYGGFTSPNMHTYVNPPKSLIWAKLEMFTMDCSFEEKGYFE